MQEPASQSAVASDPNQRRVIWVIVAVVSVVTAVVFWNIFVVGGKEAAMARREAILAREKATETRMGRIVGRIFETSQSKRESAKKRWDASIAMEEQFLKQMHYDSSIAKKRERLKELPPGEQVEDLKLEIAAEIKERDDRLTKISKMHDARSKELKKIEADAAAEIEALGGVPD